MNSSELKVKIGFIGLGKMGSGITRNLVKAGFPIKAYDIDPKKRLEYTDFSSVANDLEEVFEFCELLMLSLPGSLEVEGVVNKFIEAGVKDKTVIDLSTSFPRSSIELFNRMKILGGNFMDAPLSGNPVNALEGTLNVMAGGEKEVFDKFLPVLKAFSRNTFYEGGPGAGNVIKLANNYLSILYITLYAEILPFVEKLGIDPKNVFDVVSVSGANSPVFQLNAPKMINDKYDISFLMDLGFKDLNYLKRLMDENSAPTIMLDAGINLFKMAKCRGLGQNDISEVAKVIKDILGRKL